MKSILLVSFLSVITFQTMAQNWERCNLAVNGNSTYGSGVCVHNGKLFATNNANGIQVSTDNGATWTVVNPSFVTSQTQLLSTGDRLYAVLSNAGCSSIQYSTDEGVTFQLDTAGLPRCYEGAVTMPSAGGTSWTNHLLFSLAGPDWEFSRNTADGSWMDASYFDANDCSEFFVKNDTCWAATKGATSHGTAWSVDGINWTSPMTIGLPTYYVPSQIAFVNNRMFMMGADVANGAAGSDTIIIYSDDYGLNFQEVNIKPYLSNSPVFSISGKQTTLDMYGAYGRLFLTLSNNVFGSTPDLLVSSDGGLTFQKDTVGFPEFQDGTNYTISGMAFLNGWAFAQVNSGDLYRKQIGTVGLEEAAAQASKVKFWPNPALDKINFSKACHFTVANCFGAQLMNVENASNADVSTLAPGVYHVSILNESGLPVHRVKFVKL